MSKNREIAGLLHANCKSTTTPLTCFQGRRVSRAAETPPRILHNPAPDLPQRRQAYPRGPRTQETHSRSCRAQGSQWRTRHRHDPSLHDRLRQLSLGSQSARRMHTHRHRNPDRPLLQYISNEARDERTVLINVAITICHPELRRLDLGKRWHHTWDGVRWVVHWIFARKAEDGAMELVGHVGWGGRG